MQQLAVDLETYSSIDLAASGVYAYALAEDFEILLLAFAYDDEPARILDLCKHRGPARLDQGTVEFDESIWREIQKDLLDPDIEKTAFNANFERVCLSKYLGQQLPANQWSCTMAQAMKLGLPGYLAGVAEVLELEQKKMEAGKALINYFSKPCLPTARNNARIRNLPQHEPGKWDLFKSYCQQDVEVEREIRRKLNAYKMPTPVSESRLYALDQSINDRGILIDRQLVENAIELNTQFTHRLELEASELTGLGNPKSVSQLKAWLEAEEGTECTSLNKKAIPDLIKNAAGVNTQRVLELRQELSKSSIAKYSAMQQSVCPDGRIRGLFQYYGANRTGRWAGRLVQMQNLPQNHLVNLDAARDLLRMGDYEGFEMVFDSIPNTLSQLIRTAFIPAPGHHFVIADFSAIEARVIAWLADEKWRLDVFKTHGKIYEASAAQMFKVPVDSIKKGDLLRQKGKIAELALGYGGGPNALVKMGALEMGLDETELPKLVKMWRNANQQITALWTNVEETALAACRGQKQLLMFGLDIQLADNVLLVTLPSGRPICYFNPHTDTNKYGRTALHYDGMNQVTRKWEDTETYGGKLVENIIQAIARDCLAVSMLRLHEGGYKIVGHVHDEIILEVPDANNNALRSVCDIMALPIDWAPGLPLRADGFESDYYRKD